MEDRVKRSLDLIGSLSALLVLSPVLAAVAIAVLVNMGLPVLFRQRRPGLQGKPFTALKFRTMTEACDAEGNILPDTQRVTRLGRFLRRWSIDEVPQLWNVVKGDMSLVGPRPLLIEYLEKYTPAQARRHEVKPGITGYAQLHGRQNLLFSRRLEMDVWYIDHRSLGLDLKLIVLTLLNLHRLSAVGASPDVEKTDDLGLIAVIRKRRKNVEPISTAGRARISD
jgi:lipopolysaccharide/colanic/teichoic acid biosynthesis glycosyltransferase